MTQAAKVFHASWMTARRSFRTLRRLSPLIQEMVRSATLRTFPSPLQCGVLRLAMCGLMLSHARIPLVASLS
jgi:hypothetical protein